MLMMLIMLIPTFFQDVLQTGEILVVLIMLIPGELWEEEGGGSPPPKRINIINISPVLGTFSRKGN